MTPLLFVRHGHTEGNGSGSHIRMSGSTDLPLSAAGRVEAELVAAYLAQEHPSKVVYSSPLIRALDTATEIARRLGVVLRVAEGLSEIHCGVVDGLPVGEVEARFPEAWERNLRQDDPSFGWPGGESYARFRARCVNTIRSIAARHEGERVVVVTHAGVISQVLGFLHSTSSARWSAFRPGNASITDVHWRGDSGVIRQFDVRRHLVAKGHHRSDAT